MSQSRGVSNSAAAPTHPPGAHAQGSRRAGNRIEWALAPTSGQHYGSHEPDRCPRNRDCTIRAHPLMRRIRSGRSKQFHAIDFANEHAWRRGSHNRAVSRTERWSAGSRRRPLSVP